MQEILYRGKRIDNGEWTYGFVFTDPINQLVNQWYIVKGNGERPYAVRKETVGQYTGLHDRSGVKIFDGDVCRYNDEESCLIYWNSANALFGAFFGFQTGKVASESFRDIWNGDFEVIGNRHDNPELMEEYK